MPLGSEQSALIDSLFIQVYYTIFGMPELHSHIRYHAIKSYFQPTDTNIEIGAGIGIMSFAFRRRVQKRIWAMAYSNDKFEHLQKLMNKLQDSGVKAGKSDLLKLDLAEKFNQVLLIDVLDHVVDDKKALRNINKILKSGGYLVISVPTPLYPKYFGEEFARTIGHVRKGYTLKNLKSLLEENGFDVILWQCHTTQLSAYLCSIWYKKLSKGSFFRLLRLGLFPIFKVLSLLNELVNRKIKRYPPVSCGLAILALKRERAQFQRKSWNHTSQFVSMSLPEDTARYLKKAQSQHMLVEQIIC